MALRHRKLIPEICETICHVDQSCSSDCKICLKLCLTNPQSYSFSQPPPPPPPPPLEGSHHHALTTYLILAFALVASTLFVVCCSAIYRRVISRRFVASNHQPPGARAGDFPDEERGATVDHPIWYIRTLGLQNSVISAITVCKYKKGEGLVEGTECSVCLSEFVDDESLRLLPKCNHAFHLPCIDTWLRSHTNCPLCRAPIVTNNTVRVPSVDQPRVVVVDSSSRLELVENSGERMENTENSAYELRDGSDEEEEQLQVLSQIERRVVSIRPRRSVSLDSSSAANINLALAAILSAEESDSDSKRVTGNEDLATSSKGSSSSLRVRYLHNVPSSIKRSRSYNGKYLVSSWYGRSQTQKKPNANLRSF